MNTTIAEIKAAENIREGAHDPNLLAHQDHGACGTGFVASVNAIASNTILRHGLRGVGNMEHRGGVAADGATTDGTGITIQVDQDFWKEKFVRRFAADKLIKDGEYTKQGARDLAVGTVFMPRADRKNFNECRKVFEEAFAEEGYEISEREASIEGGELGEEARRTHPRIYQYAVLMKDGVSPEQFDADIYRIRRKIEATIRERGLSGEKQDSFYISSLSRHIVTFKGLSLAHKLENLYQDLKYNEELVTRDPETNEITDDGNYKTKFAIIHRRYATNTAPTWERAHPYHSGVAHNGEINSLNTNVAMFKQRLEKVFISLYGSQHTEIMKSVINEKGTDSAMLADVVDFMTHIGFSPPAIKSMLVPEAVMPGSEMSDDVRKMYEFIDATLGPWDGPNTMVIAGRNEIVIGGDRSGFRPVHVVRTKDGIIYGASEDGILQDIPNADVVERKNLEPGQMLAVDIQKGGIIRDPELKERAAKEINQIFGSNNLIKNIQKLDTIPVDQRDYQWSGAEHERELALRQRQGVFSQETVEYIDSMAADGKEPLGSMGDDAALAVVPNPHGKSVYRTLQNFLQQKFAQVTNPPLDTIREKVVTSLKTHIGFFFDKDGKKTDKKVYKLDSPVLTNADFKALREKIREPNLQEIDCTFDANGDENQLKTVLDSVCAQAGAMARYGKHIVLTDEYIGDDRVPIPMVLAAGAVNTHLEKLGLRGQTSINVRSAEAFEPHDFAALVGLSGADTVNAYMAEETIAARHNLGIYGFEDEFSSFHPDTKLTHFLKLYGETGDARIDEDRANLLAGLTSVDNVSEFLEKNGDCTLSDLAKHKNEDVRRMFKVIMGNKETGEGLGVSVKDLYGDKSLDHSVSNWKKASENGLLKIMGKMGISHISSYRGGRLFEALGLSQEVIDLAFAGVKTPIGGLSLTQLQQRAVEHHKDVYATDPDAPLKNVGRYKHRSGSGVEAHVLTPELIEMFQDSLKDADYKKYKEYSRAMEQRKETFRFAPTDWLDFNFDPEKAIDINQVESVDSIVQRFFTGSMSRGSISQEAHETLALAANVDSGFGRSSSGEGGEDPERYGTDKSSREKQVASARFGVTLDYLLDADVLQIKLAQGAKPGEGGELQGKKVTVEIAALRHCEPGTTLISPSTHHDIYSIEDLEQLIYDLKQVNSKAKVSVKLVATEGVDVIAAGCAKANADNIHIGGWNGGTGASPQGSISHAGMPSEIYINKAHRTLTEQGFRQRGRISMDGGLRIGRDVFIGAKLGAEEFGYGLQALIAEGCKLIRTCQNGKCPFKVAGDVGEFAGTPEMVRTMMAFIAQDLREYMAKGGYRTVDEMIGDTSDLKQVYGQDLGLNLIGDKAPIRLAAPGDVQQKSKLKPGERNDRIDPKRPGALTIDQKILESCTDQMMESVRSGKVFETDQLIITNEDRTFGGRIAGVLRQKVIDASDLGRKFAAKADSVVLNLKGVAGQSLGMALMKGLRINLEGASNDGVGKSLSGGIITVRPDHESPIVNNSHENVIIGNAALYGATDGALYAAGQAGNRFAIRLSGADAVVEGAGYAACNYQTRGTVVILGDVGHNFGSGMSGGEAFVYDENKKLEKRTYDPDTRKKIRGVEVGSDEEQRLKGLVTKHFEATGSLRSKSMLEDWDNAVQKFKYVRGKAPEPANLVNIAPAMMAA